MPVVYVIIGAASQNHMHVSSSENYNMLSERPAVAPIAQNLQSDLLSDHSSNTNLEFWSELFFEQKLVIPMFIGRCIPGYRGLPSYLLSMSMTYVVRGQGACISVKWADIDWTVVFLPGNALKKLHFRHKLRILQGRKHNPTETLPLGIKLKILRFFPIIPTVLVSCCNICILLKSHYARYKDLVTSYEAEIRF